MRQAAARLVVVGNGPAAHRLVTRLAELGHTGPVTVLGAEPHPAYQRSLLGSVLDGSLPPGALTLPAPPPWVRYVTGAEVLGIDPDRRLVRAQLPTGRWTFWYDRLVLATGASPAGLPRPAVPGTPVATDRVRNVGTLADVMRPVHGRVAVVGGGVLGVETAAALRRRGHPVTLVHRGLHPMDRQLDEVAGELVASWLQRQGIALRFDKHVEDPDQLSADTVLLCTGRIPNTALARAAGLDVRRGIVVDASLRTSDRSIHAIGDCVDGSDGVLPQAWAQAEALAEMVRGGPARPVHAPLILRPRIHGLDIAVLGAADAAAPADETATFSDPARGRYAHLDIVDGRIQRARLVGLPDGIAATAQLYDRNAPVPADRWALLTGTERRPPTDLTAADDAVLCQCNNVRKAAIAEACRTGPHDFDAVVRATHATTGCGMCADTVRAVCAAVWGRRSGAESGDLTEVAP